MPICFTGDNAMNTPHKPATAMNTGTKNTSTMDAFEKLAIGLAILLISTFFGAVLFATVQYNVSVPTCVTSLPPFKESKIIERKDKKIEVHVLATMWLFDMGDTNPGELRLPVGADVNLFLASSDVVHGFHIEGKNVNLMAVPGAVNNVQVRFDRIGEYRIVCHEYCGVQHQAMAGVIKVLSDADYEKALQE
jgi:cytochrome c oxidase subunit II